MPTYDEIKDVWFAVRIAPGSGTYEAFESEDAAEERLETNRVIDIMAGEVIGALDRNFGLYLRFEPSDLIALDEAITPAFVSNCIKDSSPAEMMNFFKVTISEMAVLLGNIFIAEVGGKWKYSRMPNWFQSSVVTDEGFELFPFVILMKRFSSDVGHELIYDKFNDFTERVLQRRAKQGGA